MIEGKGLRVYPGMIDSGTELGLSEVPAERETVDTGELGEFMPQLRALIAVNPESEHFRRGPRQRHHQRDDLSLVRWAAVAAAASAAASASSSPARQP